MTTKGFRTRWRKAKASYRNATGGRKNAERKKLVLLVAEELKREINSTRIYTLSTDLFTGPSAEAKHKVAA